MNKQASIAIAALVVVVIILAGWYMWRQHSKSEFGEPGLGHGRAPMGGGSRLFEKERLGGHGGGGGGHGGGGGGHGHGGGHGGWGGGHGGWGGGGRRGWGGGRRGWGGGHGGWGGGRRGWGGRGRHWARLHSGAFRRPAWWNTEFYGYPWWYWWRDNPSLANQWVANYPGYCEWCAICDNLDPDASSDFCAGCEANCPRPLL